MSTGFRERWLKKYRSTEGMTWEVTGVFLFGDESPLGSKVLQVPSYTRFPTIHGSVENGPFLRHTTHLFFGPNCFSTKPWLWDEESMWVDFLQKFSPQLFKINWRRQGGVSKIETKLAAGKLEGWKTLGADFSRLLLEVVMYRSILGIPETKPTMGIFCESATSCYFFPVPFRIFR